MNILLTIPFSSEQVKQIEDLGCEILFENEQSSEFQADYSAIEALMTFNSFKRLSREQLPNLRWIQLTSIGFDQVPDSFQEVMITNNQGGYSPQIGEWVVGMILAMEKEFHALYDQQKSQTWKLRTSINSLAGKTVLFLGTGSLAQESVKRLAGFDVTITGANRSGHSVPGFDQVVALNQVDSVLSQADHVICCLPATPDTIGLINREFILKMKPNAHLQNVSRGRVVNQTDLIAHHDHLGLIALDVFEKEPLPAESELWKLDNVLISPHNSWFNQSIQQIRFNVFYHNLQNYLAKQPLKNQVDLARGY